MILLKIYTDAEYENIVSFDESKALTRVLSALSHSQEPEEEEVSSWSNVFNSIYYKTQKPPFRDQESVAFLETFGITFVDGDWYSVKCGDTRMPLSGLDNGYKIALSAISCSRRGKYIWYDYLGFDILKYLSEMPFDVLLAVCLSHLDDIDSIISGKSGCKFVNFPYQGKAIGVLCKPYHDFKSEGYIKLPCSAEYGHCLYKGSDGVYYCDEEVTHILRYRWWDDIENIIKYIDSCKRTKVYLSRPSQTYSLFELGDLVAGDENAIAELEYFRRMRELEKDYNSGRITRGHYELGVKRLQNGSWYKKYLYYKDVFKAICHLAFIPEEQSGELGIMIVDRNPDGTYSLIGDKTYFRPAFCDAICSMLFKANGANNYEERVGLAVAGGLDWRNTFCLKSVKDIDNAVYGFRALKDSIEIFDKYEAIQTFGAALREAQESGKCTGYEYVTRVIEI